MTTVSRSQVATARDAGDGLAVGRQVFRSHLAVIVVQFNSIQFSQKRIRVTKATNVTARPLCILCIDHYCDCFLS